MLTSYKKSMKNYFALIGLLLIASSCSNDMKSSLGLRKSAPDEFTVISNPSLSVPPDFTLANPGDDTKLALSIDQHNQAVSKDLSKAEQEFLNKLGQSQNAGNAANQIDSEYRKEIKEQNSKGAIRKAVSKLNSTKQPVIDPSAEKARIKNNLDNNIPINEGTVVEKKSRSTLDNILN